MSDTPKPPEDNPWADFSEDALNEYETEKAEWEAERARAEAMREAARQEELRQRAALRAAEADTAGPEPETDPDADTVAARVWDTPDDHQMSNGARRAWQVAVFGALIAIPAGFFALSPFGPGDTVKHTVSAMGCQFADLFDMTDAEIGQPGYYEKFDEDGNGIACENIYADAGSDAAKPRISVGGGSGAGRFVSVD